MRTKAIRLLVEDALPEDVRGTLTGLDSGSMGDLLAEVARVHPERYAEVSKKLADIGRHASYWQGETISLADIRPVIDRRTILGSMDAEIAKAKLLHKDDPAAFKEAREAIWSKYSDDIQKATMSSALAGGNSLGYSVASGARGKPAQLKAMLSTPGLYSGSGGKMVPLFVRNGFNSGLRPAEFLAGSYGARESIVTIKTATAKGGYLGKLMAQAAAPIVITEKDCGVDNGVDFPADSSDLRYRVLARPAAGLAAGTILDRPALARLKKSGGDGFAIVRSPITCGAENGICAKCYGADARGKLPPVGASVGITDTQAVSEPIAQGSLSAKHESGQAKSKREFSGFDVVNRFVQAPEVFPDRAAVAELDGKVTAVTPAAQGGTNVQIGDQVHYVLPGYPVLVKPGDRVEAGDALSEGLGDPSDIVRLRGLGGGRRYYTDRLKQILADSGMPAYSRNVETFTRAALDHVTVDDDAGLDGVLPDDVISYSRVRRLYTPPEDTKEDEPENAIGKFLQRDALHYTIGTRVTPSVAKHLASRKFGKIQVSEKQPGFNSSMVRLQSATHNNPDWLASQHTSYLKRQLSEDAARGNTTNVAHNTHFAPRLAVGTDFGRKVEERGEF